jgi:rubrerythrin
MLTEQCAKLRKAAEFYDGFEAASLMRNAADTIENLRNRLTEYGMCQIEQDWDCDEYPQARWWRCHGCGERFLYQRGLNPTYCPECGLQRVVE